MNRDTWTGLADWLAEFRKLHAEARAGKLDAKALVRYSQDREVLMKALLIAQRLAVKPGKMPRQTLRVGAELPVELVIGDRREAVTTLDLGLGGFAAMMPKAPKVLDRFSFVMTLRSSTGAAKGRVRVVNTQRKGKPFRVAFAFDELSPEDIDRIGLEVFDAALSTIPPK